MMQFPERTQPGRQLRPLSAREGVANEHVQHLADTIENTVGRGGIIVGDEVPNGIKIGVYLGAFVEPPSHAGPRRGVAGRAPWDRSSSRSRSTAGVEEAA